MIFSVIISFVVTPWAAISVVEVESREHIEAAMESNPSFVAQKRRASIRATG